MPLEILWRNYRRLAMRDRSDFVDEFGRDPVYASRIEPILDFLYRRYFRVDTRGLENVPDVGRALLVANHSGTLPYDGALLMYAVRREHQARRDVRPLVEDFVFHFPYLGTFINRIGGVRACQENAERLLESDQVVAVFPEGIKGIGKLYRERYKLQRFGRGGFVKLALRTRSPIVPVAVVGAEEIHPMLTKVTWFAKSLGIPYVPITPTFPALGPLGALPLPVKWYLRFGEPIDVAAEHGPDAAEDRILVNRLAEQVRVKIQSMIDETLRQRRSILFG
jgi:1-acyl-sn-glycerol-3-phosphate acyltransferase